ncbi:MAG TPA: hypothetical protein PLG24_10915, partial [Saprospiraceae bacterium]|nr:hypothetical protein [Saprospiraceae bacterium]
MKYFASLLGILFLFLFSTTGFSQDDLPRIELVKVFSGLSKPVSLQSCNDNRIFIVEKGGKIKIGFPDGSVLDSNFLNISDKVLSGGERGLLGLAF